MVRLLPLLSSCYFLEEWMLRVMKCKNRSHQQRVGNRSARPRLLQRLLSTQSGALLDALCSSFHFGGSSSLLSSSILSSLKISCFKSSAPISLSTEALNSKNLFCSFVNDFTDDFTKSGSCSGPITNIPTNNMIRISSRPI